MVRLCVTAPTLTKPTSTIIKAHVHTCEMLALEKILKYKVVAMIVFASGCLLDHLTTGYGISLPYISEMNPSVLILMEWRIWHVVEVLLISAGLCSGYLAILSKSNYLNGASTIGLFSGGFFRLYAGLHNLTLIINAVH